MEQGERWKGFKEVLRDLEVGVQKGKWEGEGVLLFFGFCLKVPHVCHTTRFTSTSMQSEAYGTNMYRVLLFPYQSAVPISFPCSECLFLL